MSEKFDLIVLGSGPGGYVAAIKAAQLGKKVACVEKSELGGVCLNWGCIPTKALIKNADMWLNIQKADSMGFEMGDNSFNYPEIIKRSRKTAEKLSKGIEFLFKKNDITQIKGFGKFNSQKQLEVTDGDESKILEADKIIIATGARAKTIPGIDIDGKKIISSREALVLKDLPESMTVIGAGAIGVEFAYIFNTFGVKVTIVEALPHIMPNEDDEIVKAVTRALKKQKIKINAGTPVKSINTDNEKIETIIEKKGKEKTLESDLVLMAIGVQPNSEDMGLEDIGVKTEKGWIKVDDHYKTNIDGIYAIGDVIGDPCLAHVASAEGIHAVEQMFGHEPELVNYKAVPGCTYCHPQIASVGMTEKEAADNGHDVKVGKCHFRAMGKAIAIEEIDGLVKVIFDAESDVLLGAHITGAEATELIAELVNAVDKKMTFDQLKNVIHAHPTLSETVIEAIHDAYDEAIHV
ncbi:MAG: dihydrolipoyl dehydrogenase [Fidelibacterota bacterium]